MEVHEDRMAAIKMLLEVEGHPMVDNITNNHLTLQAQLPFTPVVRAVVAITQAIRAAEASQVHTRAHPAWHHERLPILMPTLALPPWVKCKWFPECMDNTPDIHRWVANK